MGESDKCLNVQKLSTEIPSASEEQAQRQLHSLRNMIKHGAELSEEMTSLVEKLKSVAASDNEPFIFTKVLAENEQLLRYVFRDCADVKFRSFQISDRQAQLVYIDGMCDTELLENQIIKPLMNLVDYSNWMGEIKQPVPGEDAMYGKVLETSGLDFLIKKLLPAVSLTVFSKATEVSQAVMSGDALLLVDGHSEVLVIGAAKYVKRNIAEAKSEGVVRGPQDAFNESLKDNLVLIRRRTRDTNVKIRVMKVGERTKTDVALVYCADLVKPSLLEEVENRVKDIKADEVFLSFTVEEALVEHPWTPFPQLQSTEKPERLVTAIYEGRIGIIVDNTPFAIMVPTTYRVLMQTTDDYTLPAVVASFLRLTRHISAFLAVYLPAIYVGIVSFNPGILPTAWAISIAELRARSPFPSVLEALMMEALLEIFQEALARLPIKLAGGASMVGAFVIGTTVVQAGLINPLLVVVTAVTAIASYSMSNYSLSLALRWVRIPLLVLATTFGLFGVVLGALVITVHLCSLRNFGESYLGGLSDITLLEEWKDGIVKLPAKFLTSRPKEFGAQERKRQGDGNA